MELALLSSVKPPLIQILNANRGAYSASVGTTAATGLGAFPFDQEITDACIKADGLIVTAGYFQTLLSLRNRFLTASPNIASGEKLPEFIGQIGKAEWSVNGATAWKDSRRAASKDDVTQANELGSYAGGVAAFQGLHFYDEGFVFHSSPFFRVNYPSYTKTAALQCAEAHEPAIVAGAIMLLAKQASNAPHEYYSKLFYDLLTQIKSGVMDLSGMASRMQMP